MKSSSLPTSIWVLALTLAFALTALAGVWAAYDRGAAWGRFGLIAAGLVAAMGIAWAGRRWGDRALGPAGVGCALLAAAVGAYFLLAFDWSGNGTGKFVAVQDAGMWIQAHRPRVPLPEDINGNVAGSALAVLIPLGLGGAVWAWRDFFADAASDAHAAPGAIADESVPQAGGLRVWRSKRQSSGLPHRRILRAGSGPTMAPALAFFLAFISTFALILSLFALLLTASRGAWLGLAAGGLVALVLAWSDRRHTGARSTPKRVLPWVLIAAIALASAAVFFGAVMLPGFDRLLGSVGGIGNSALGRAALWRDGLALAGDYPFTGAGLGSTMMVYSTYALLLHVGFITHSHNLFLQIALEQGLPGLAAFLGLVGLALWMALRGMGSEITRGPARIWQIAAAASLVALVVHGTMDTGIYASRVLPLMFLPFGFAFAGAGAEVKVRTKVERPTVLYAVIAASALAFVLALLPPTRAAFQANLGAVAQTRAELAVYRWPRWPIQDALRRAPEVNLAPALARFRAALALDPGNATANRRLGQIELSRGEYEPARSHLEAAYAAAPGQRATRQLLGEAYAIAGEVARAAGIWRTIDLGEGQLALRAWWYENAGEKESAQRITDAGREAGW